MNTTTIDGWNQGIVCFWDAKTANHGFLKGAMGAVGLGKYCPPPYSVGASLKLAMAEYGRAHRKELLEGFENRTNTTIEVKRHENANNDGYEMIAVEHGKERNEYPRIFSAKVEMNGSECTTLTSGWSVVSDTYQIQAAYERNRQTCSASSVGQMLVKMVGLANGTCVREIGGVYYLPDGAANTWRKLCQAIDSPNGTQITWHEIRLNESSMRSIAASITKEITANAQKRFDKVMTGELGARALANQIESLKELRGKLHTYEVILDSPLQDVRELLKKARDAANMAHMLTLQDDVPA